MDIRLHNTFSRKTEVFKPLIPSAVGMYHCGPTVYDFAHIGNLRSYVFADIVRRVFEYNGYTVNQVINITDVGHLSSDADEGEDKMTKALKRDGKPLTLESMHEVGAFYTERFIEDLKSLNIELPQNFPRASEHIPEDLEIIEKLITQDIAYTTSDGIYFDTSKFPEYGKLGNIQTDKQQEGNRIAINPEKRNPSDFALWKFDSKLGWDTSWGKGFPGWHLECSAMSRKYLGQPFDIHTGGIDHIPTHHNNEIAQSESAFGLPLANFWLHNEFILQNGGKMAKSAGEYLTLKSLAHEVVSPLAYRYWLLTAHYRSPMNFTLEAVHAAQTALIRLITNIRDLPTGGAIATSYRDRFQTAVNDDLDTPQGIALLWELLKDKNLSDADKRATTEDFDRIFGLNLASLSPIEELPVPAEVQALADAREEARKEKDWGKADALRKEIEARGFEVMDTTEGIKVREKE